MPEYRPLAAHVVAAINEEQERLFRDPRVREKLEWFKRTQLYDPPTFYTTVSPCGVYIIELGNAAKTSCEIDEADFLFGDCQALERWGSPRHRWEDIPLARPEMVIHEIKNARVNYAPKSQGNLA